MYSKIKRLRTGGERLADRDISSDPGTVGYLTVVLLDNVPVASVYDAYSSGRQTPLLPMLFRATLVSMHNDRMLLQGFERVGAENDLATPLIKQEWAVQVMAEQPRGPALPADELA